MHVRTLDQERTVRLRAWQPLALCIDFLQFVDHPESYHPKKERL